VGASGVRLFVAVNPGERFIAALTTALDDWRPRLPLSWTAPDAWHLTLQFLAEWPENRLPGLVTALTPAADVERFLIEPGATATFGRRGDPRVLFLQMEGAGQAAQLAAGIRAAVAGCWPDGPQDNRPFRSHLTLARIRRPLGPDELKVLSAVTLETLPAMAVDGFSLMASTLGPKGASHAELAFFPLRKKGE